MNEFQGLKISKGAYKDVRSYLLRSINNISQYDYFFVNITNKGCTSSNCPGCACSKCLFFTPNKSVLKKYIQWQLRRIRYE